MAALLGLHEDQYISVWKVVFAAAALADLSTCWPLVVQGWNHRDQDREASCAPSQHVGLFFCFLCVIEAVIRAREARNLAIEVSALDKFEKSLSRAYSTTRVSFGMFGVSPDADMDKILARSTLRTWIPVSVTLFFWFSLLPVSLDYQCGNDAALATMWITSAFAKQTIAFEVIHKRLATALWKWAQPYKITQPRRFYKRIRQLLRAIRFIRFAGPLARMGLKLWDQLKAMTRTWRQSLAVQAEKAKRMQRPSMLFEDLQRVESLVKVQTAIAALPSQLFNLAREELEPIRNNLLRQQERGRQITRKLKQLKNDIRQSISSISISEKYDRIVQMTQELKVTLHDSLLTSHELISPRSRFSVVWRMTVTNCLLLEIFRLNESWRLTGTFKVPLKQIIGRLFIDCEVPQVTRHLLSFVTKRVGKLRKNLSHKFPSLLPPPEDLMLCVPASSSAVLLFGSLLEIFVDVVAFLDIFIWFSTGDLDAAGIIIPKPFFTRCILPGTLVQVLDHPTLPTVLPTIISRLLYAAEAVGWSRSIRWALALAPSFEMLVSRPLMKYFFRHFERTEGLMRYAESCGMISPARTSVSTSMSNLKRYQRKSYGVNLHDVTSYPSQIGLSYDSPNHSSRGVISSTIQEEDSLMAPPLDSLNLPLRQSTVKFRSSVFIDEDDNSSNTYDCDEGFSVSCNVGLHYSARS
jgi:hypothetical protein